MGDIAIIDFKVTRVDINELITGSQKRGMRLDTEMGDRSLGIGGTHLPRLMLVSTCHNSSTDSKNGKECLPQSVVLSRLSNLGSWVSHSCAGMGWCFMLMGQGGESWQGTTSGINSGICVVGAMMGPLQCTGVIEGIMGMDVGEEKGIETTVGDAWWEPEGLAGIPVRCDVALRETFEWNVPEVGTLPVKNPCLITGRLRDTSSACKTRKIHPCTLLCTKE